MELKEFTVLIDNYGEIRDKRLAADKIAANLKEQEVMFEQSIITELLKNESMGAAGSHYRVTLKKDTKPTTTDWTQVFEYIKLNDAFDIVQRRLTEGAVKARWEEGIEIPGVSKFQTTKLTVARS